MRIESVGICYIRTRRVEPCGAMCWSEEERKFHLQLEPNIPIDFTMKAGRHTRVHCVASPTFYMHLLTKGLEILRNYRCRFRTFHPSSRGTLPATAPARWRESCVHITYYQARTGSRKFTAAGKAQATSKLQPTCQHKCKASGGYLLPRRSEGEDLHPRGYGLSERSRVTVHASVPGAVLKFTSSLFM